MRTNAISTLSLLLLAAFGASASPLEGARSVKSVILNKESTRLRRHSQLARARRGQEENHGAINAVQLNLTSPSSFEDATEKETREIYARYIKNSPIRYSLEEKEIPPRAPRVSRAIIDSTGRRAVCKPKSTTSKTSSASPSPTHKSSSTSSHASSTAVHAQATSSPSSASSSSSSSSSSQSGSRLDRIKSMYAFEGFVYDLEGCQSKSKMVSDFQSMHSAGARTVITFSICSDDDSSERYDNVIAAAQQAKLNIIPLVWTLLDGSGSVQSTIIPRMNKVIQSVIKNPSPVLAVALGDEPLFDNDFGSPSSLASTINQMKSQFKSSGLSIPVSISDMAFGWQQGDSSPVADAVDFFMMNNFPYFSSNAAFGNSGSTWTNFQHDISYFEGIAKGRPLLVTQTGWPSNKDEFQPNSNSVTASVSSEQAYWNILDSHCGDFFKSKNIGWMWRSWDDTIMGWGVKDSNGNSKINIGAKTSC